MEVSLSAASVLPQNARICILRLSAIGDVCHAVAMVQRIQANRPDVAITWIIGKVEYQLVAGLANVDFVVYDKKTGRQGIKAIRQQFRGVRFDALCLMQVALRANLLSRAINAKVRIGFDKARSKEGHGLFINQRIAAQHHPHVLDGFMAFADALGISEQGPTWQLPLSSDDWHYGEALASRLGRFAVIAPAASKAERNWHAQGYAGVANFLSEQGVKVVLCGGPGPIDRQIGDAIATQGAAISEDLIGKTSLKQLAGVLAKATLVIAPDTGPAHMATCMGTSVVGLYAHSNPRRTGPYYSADYTVSVYDNCIAQQCGKPWTELPWGKRAKGEFLMDRIQLSQVIEIVEKVLKS